MQRLKRIAFRLLQVFGPQGRIIESFKMLVTSFAGHLPSQRSRVAIYRSLGLRVDTTTVIYGALGLRACERIWIGANSSVGDGCVLDGRGGLYIGRSVNLSTGVFVWTADHDPQSRTFAGRLKPVVIEDLAWISCRAVILPGVTIGQGSVVAAGAVVVSDVEAYTIVGGIPAKKIGSRSRGIDYKLTKWYHFV